MQYLLLLVQLLPTILDIIRAVEAAVPHAGQGAAKFNAVLNVVQGIALDAPLLIGSGNEAVQAVKVGDVPGMSHALTSVINTGVKLFNDVGAFKSSTEQPGG